MCILAHFVFITCFHIMRVVYIVTSHVVAAGQHSLIPVVCMQVCAFVYNDDLHN